jgi:rhodanese-related sulfurtransferase
MAANIKRVSPAEARSLVEQGYTYVDVRSVPEFEQAHPAGALNVPLLHSGPGGMVPNPEFLSVMEATFPRDAKLVLGCRSGARSLRAATQLAEAGYTDVIDQRAGFEGPKDAFGATVEPGWGPAGLPAESGSPAGRSYADIKGKRG